MPSDASDYGLCGWHLRSDIRFPELAAWHGDASHAPDLTIRRGAVPDMPGGVAVGALVRVDGHGNLFLNEPGQSRVLVTPDHTATVETAADGDPHRLRLRLLAFLPGFVSYRRDALPLHAEVVDVHGRAIALCGPSGSGKSTLAAALVRRGHGLLCDDIAVTRMDASGRPRMHPGVSQLKLSPAVADRLDLKAPRVPLTGRDPEKVLLRLAPPQDGSHRPLAALLLLSTADGPPTLARMSPFETLGVRHHFLYRPLLALGQSETALSARFLALLQAVPVYRLCRPHQMNSLDQVAQTVEAFADTL